MSVSICANCLSRLRLSPRTLPSLSAIPNTSPFHTSSAQQSSILKKKVGGTQQFAHREARSARIKKKTKERPRPPAVGERRTARTRIVLSNTNALEVTGMADLSAENMADVTQVGKVLGLEGHLLDQLREVKAFKTTQNWSMFRRPATLIREETVELGKGFEGVNESLQDNGRGPKTVRQIITGTKSCGKSLLLLQAMSMAFMNKWVVINVPEAQDLVNNTSAYGPAPTTKEGEELQYIQPNLASLLLTRVAYGNNDVLSKHKVLHNHTATPFPLKNGLTLKDLAMVGVEDASVAWPVWQALWKELTSPAPRGSTPPPPILVAIDGLDHWMGPSKYRSATFDIIHAHQFLLINHFLTALFNTTPFANGGIVLAATTGSNAPATPTLALLLRQLQARASGLVRQDPKFPVPSPYASVDVRVAGLLGETETTVQELKGLSKHEARGLLEYYARSGVWKEEVSEVVVAEKWGLSGGGLVGEMAKLGARLRV